MPPNPIELSARLASRLVDELRGPRADSLQNIVRLATRGAELLERLNERAEAGLAVGERLDSRAEAILEFGERIDKRAEAILAMGERIDARAEAILEFGERIDERGSAIVSMGERLDGRGGALLEAGETFNELGERMIVEARLVHTRASEVVAQAAELQRAIPTAERAVDLMQPLEGAVERLGRMVDRLPGGRGRDDRDQPRGP